MNSTAAIFTRLSTAPTIVSELDTYAGAPAIFSDRAPDDFDFADKAALIIAAPFSDDPEETFTEIGRAIRQDVRIYAKDTGSTLDVDNLARAVRKLFHNQPAALIVDGGKCTIITATGPVAAPTTDPSLVGRRVTLRLELQET